MTSEPPYWIRCKVIDLWTRRQRAVEEEQYCLSEMRQTINFFRSVHCQLKTVLESDNETQSSVMSLSVGQRSLLLNKLLRLERRCLALQGVFGNHIRVDAIETYFTTEYVNEQQTDADDIDDVQDTDIDCELSELDLSVEECGCD